MPFRDLNKKLKTSLAVFKPKKVIDFICEPTAREWLEDKKEMFNQLNIFDEINDGCARNEFESGKLWSLLFEGHKIAYDFAGLKTLGEKAGFVVEKKTFCNGNKQIIKETIDMLPEISLFVEMTKN